MSKDSHNEPEGDNTQIRHSSITMAPPSYTFLPTVTMASTSTRTQTQTQGTATQSQPTPPPSTLSQIASIFHQHFTPPEASSGGGGRGGGGGGEGRGGGGGGRGSGGQLQQQQNVPAAADVKAMGKLPNTFDSDQAKAEDFIEEVKGYLCLNQDVARFNSLMKKVAFILTHMKGPKVANWVKTMEETIEGLDPLVDNISAI